MMAAAERKLRFALRALVATTVSIGSSSASQPVELRALDLGRPHSPDTLIVKLRLDGPGAQSFSAKLPEILPLAEPGVAHLESFGMLIVRLREGGDDALQSAAEEVASAGDVEFVQPSYLVSINYLMEDSGSGDVDQWALARIEADAAQASIANPQPVVVAVIDTGAATHHPDLSPALWHNPCEACGNAFDDSCVDGRKNGYVDDGHGWNFLDGDDQLSDVATHGTEVAAVIGAVPANGVCIDGVSAEAELMILKAIPAHRTAVEEAPILAALDYVRREGVRIVNASWSLGWDPVPSPAMGLAFSVLAAHDVLVVAPAGAEDFPCADAFPNVICVGPTAEVGDGPIGTSWDHKKVHLGAPGESIATATLPSACALRRDASIAAPHVTGVAALILAKCPDASVDELIRRIVQCTDEVDALASKTISGGRLNARRAVSGVCGVIPSDCTRPYQVTGSTPK